jgi:glycogen debranching enzyme
MSRLTCPYARAALCFLGLVAAPCGRVCAQTPTDRDVGVSRLAWSTDSTGPRRLISVHGRRAAILGYSQEGLEIWDYPFQIVTSFGAGFRREGETTAIDGQRLLRRIIYSPETVIRVYAGADFIVREKLFVPLDEPGAIISYEVQSSRPVEIIIHFLPVLDLMWPASVGGQETTWNSAASAYILSEPTHRFTASIVSPDTVSHDETPNGSQQVVRSNGLAFTLRAAGGHHTVRLAIAGAERGQDASAIGSKLLRDCESLEKDAITHYSSLLSRALEIETPDADANRALAWSEIALDQAWVCNPDLGCGAIAGYGPSRKARRPQYDWFFAGDGMVAVRALLAAGLYDPARQELEFILKYQNKETGMIWHELSQSAGWLDWGKYPYMYLHVDLTSQFLATVGAYFSVSGDHEFVAAHWPSIQAADDYCRSLLDPQDGLPRIPSAKRGEREQEELGDELGLSASWAAAAQAFADLAAATDHNQAAAEAGATSQQVSRAIGRRYWDERQHFWITGYTLSGKPVADRSLGPVGNIGPLLFSPAQRDAVFDQLASSDFQTDWGTRGRASSASTYDPNSYAAGSVWAIGTSGAAAAFWAEHRPVTALPIWNALVPWSSLDSLGHMHEVLAGDYYREQLESVPEQTWSSAGFFSAAVNGLLGLQVDGASNRIRFGPHLPPNWSRVTLRHVHLNSSEVALSMVQSANEVRLEIQNDGAPVGMVFDPEIPFGAKLTGARLGTQSVIATLEPHEQDSHARVEVPVPHGNTTLTVGYTGGVAIIPEAPRLLIGEPSRAMKMTGIHRQGRVYRVDFDYVPAAANSFEVRTPWIIQDADGANFQSISPGLFRILVTASTSEKPDAYRHGTVQLTFAARPSH